MNKKLNEAAQGSMNTRYPGLTENKTATYSHCPSAYGSHKVLEAYLQVPKDLSFQHGFTCGMDWEEENPMPLAMSFVLVGGYRTWKKMLLCRHSRVFHRKLRHDQTGQTRCVNSLNLGAVFGQVGSNQRFRLLSGAVSATMKIQPVTSIL